jgi:hypothetical protein
MVTKAKQPTFTAEQDVLLLEFLEKAESWVQGFTWNLSDDFKEALGEAKERLSDQLKTIQTGLAEKPGQTVVGKLGRQRDAIKTTQAALKGVKLRVGDRRGELVRYEIAAALYRTGRDAKAQALRQVDVRLEVTFPVEVKVPVGGAVSLPYELERGQEKLWDEDEDEYRERLLEQEAERIEVLDKPDKWKTEPPLASPELKVSRKHQYWYLVVAPRSEGVMASFQRLQMIRGLMENPPAGLFGVVTDNEKLCELANEQGYMTFLSTR